MQISRFIITAALVGLIAQSVFAADSAKSVSALDFGAKGDGIADDSGAIQSALDSVGQDGVVKLPAGLYRITRTIDLPHGTTLIGDSPRWENGATRLIINEPGFPAVRLHHVSNIKGLMISFPNNRKNVNPTPYPPAIVLDGINPSVENIVFDSAWIGISTDPKGHTVGQGLFRNLSGFVHHVGIHLSNCRDVNRIENVHWFVGGDFNGDPNAYYIKNRVGFEFGDVDGIIMTGCFIIGGKTFFHQMKYKDTPDGSKQPAHSLGFQIDKCWVEDVDNGFIFEGATGFVLNSANILVRKGGVGVRVDAESLFYNAVISGVQVRTFGAPVVGFEYDIHQPHPRNKLTIADCQVVDGAPAVLLKSGAIRAQIHDCHLQSVPEHPAIRIDKGADLIMITNNILNAKIPILDNSGPKAQKTISGNLFEKQPAKQ
ncbi:MAG: glycosyl hydrolase family 28-related protein [Armatimonadota bacterium]